MRHSPFHELADWETFWTSETQPGNWHAGKLWGIGANPSHPRI